MLLAMDTSTRWMGLALYDGAGVLGEMIWQTRNHHTVELAPGVSSLMERCGVKAADLKVVAAALGPGSFTSLRIGLALAKGMALALHLPVVGVPSLDVLAAAIPVQEKPLAAVLQAGRGRLALAMFRAHDGAWKQQGEIKVVSVEELAQLLDTPSLVAGELIEGQRDFLRHKRAISILSPALALRRPSFLAEIAWKRWQAKQVDEVVSLAPIYLHAGVVIPT
jgi:tRNA threonylcarbamoyladenosine biosynthesis protein TsaB